MARPDRSCDLAKAAVGEAVGPDWPSTSRDHSLPWSEPCCGARSPRPSAPRTSASRRPPRTIALDRLLCRPRWGFALSRRTGVDPKSEAGVARRHGSSVYHSSMARLLLVPGLLGGFLLFFWLWALFDVIMTDSLLIRNMQKGTWVFMVLLVPVVGAAAWVLLGRPEGAAAVPGGQPSNGRTRFWSGPGQLGVEDTPGWSKPRSRPSRPSSMESSESLAIRERKLMEREAELAKREEAIKEREDGDTERPDSEDR